MAALFDGEVGVGSISHTLFKTFLGMATQGNWIGEESVVLDFAIP